MKLMKYALTAALMLGFSAALFGIEEEINQQEIGLLQWFKQTPNEARKIECAARINENKKKKDQLDSELKKLNTKVDNEKSHDKWVRHGSYITKLLEYRKLIDDDEYYTDKINQISKLTDWWYPSNWSKSSLIFSQITFFCGAMVLVHRFLKPEYSSIVMLISIFLSKSLWI